MAVPVKHKMYIKIFYKWSDDNTEKLITIYQY